MTLFSGSRYNEATGMTDIRLYFAILVPVLAIIVGILAGILQMNFIGRRFTSVEVRFTSLEATMNARFTSLEARFDTILERH